MYQGGRGDAVVSYGSSYLSKPGAHHGAPAPLANPG